jgi:hypothetical protein
MTADKHTVRVSPAPFVIGILLWGGATALLCEDAYRSGHMTVQHALMPLLTASTVAAAVFAHLRLREWRVIGAVMFAALAVLGSVLTVYGTLGRIATQHDQTHAKADASNAATKRLQDDLTYAKAERAKECKTRGKRCASWDERVDSLTEQLEGRVTVSTDPKVDAVVRIAKLFGAPELYTRELIAALDAPSLPLFLELGSVIFFAGAFQHRKVKVHNPVTAPEAVSGLPSLTPDKPEKLSQVYTRAEALADFTNLQESGSQRFLSERWGVSEPTVSRWMQAWAGDGKVARGRDGKAMAATAMLPAPKHKRLGHMARLDLSSAE